jgi:hypothetical protein
MRYILLLVVLMVGCSSKPDVHPDGNGRYIVTASAYSNASNGQALARANAVKKATRFCRKSSNAMNTETFDEQPVTGGYSSSLVFSCR